MKVNLTMKEFTLVCESIMFCAERHRDESFFNLVWNDECSPLLISAFCAALLLYAEECDNPTTSVRCRGLYNNLMDMMDSFIGIKNVPTETL